MKRTPTASIPGPLAAVATDLTLQDAAAAVIATEQALRRHAAEEYLALVQYLYQLAREEAPSLTLEQLTLEFVEQRNAGKLLRTASAALATLKGCEPKSMRAALITALNLYQHGPQLLEKLHAGLISRATAQTAANKLKSLRLPDPKKQEDGQPWEPAELRHATAEILDGKTRLGHSLENLAAEDLSDNDFATRAAAELEQHHPHDAGQRHRAAVARRHVRISACPDGMGRLELYDAADTIRQIAERLSASAQRNTSGDGTQNDGRTRTQMEADILTDLILRSADAGEQKQRGSTTASRPSVFVLTTLTDFMAAGGHVSDEFRGFIDRHFPQLSKHVSTAAKPAPELPKGPSLTETKILGTDLRPHADALAATLLKAGLLQVIITDPATGYPIGIGGQYRPPPIVKRLLALRDQHCRYPGCRAPATMCETDHVHPFAESGQTAYGNLALWCKEHHTGKTARWWDVTPAPAEGDGALQIRNKGSGQTHISQPELPLHPAAWADQQQRQDQANAPPF